eukprot:gb/GECH01003137.1/.p1 GENE.gb/GECH01003137.1/~~gb/GECH01003137.1/.p1  ORF type:complete len:795 (+),score=155.01 gb/GECH01003137.1/:1-2385(+)
MKLEIIQPFNFSLFRLLSFWFLLFLLLFLFNLNLADSNTYVSSTLGNDKNGTGTEENPYQTIQKAINELNPLNVTHNIFVSPGIYKEHLQLKSLSDPINLIAQHQNNTDNIVTLSLEDIKDNPGVLIDSSVVNFFGFEFIGSNSENGIIHCNGPSSSLYIENCIIMNNTIKVYRTEDELQLEKSHGLIKAVQGCSLFVNQTVMEENTGELLSGIHVHNSDVELQSLHCRLQDANADKSYASCMFVEGTSSTAVIESSEFFNNTGAPLRFDNIAKVTISNSQFISNSVESSLTGSTVAILNTPALISDSTFDSNIASDGGGLFMGDSSESTIVSSYFLHNQATNSGGAISITRSSSSHFTEAVNPYLIHRSHFMDNHAANDGSAIYIASANAQYSGSVSHSNITGNHGSSAISVFGAQIQLSHTHVKGNAAQHGGGIQLREKSRLLSDSDTVITNNKAQGNGGGIAIIRDNGKDCSEAHAYIISNTTLSQNKAKKGGGIYSVCDLAVKQSTITHNVATISGAGIAVHSALLSLSDVIVSSGSERPPSSGQLQGGGISGDSSIIHINRGGFYSNTAAYGGGIHGSDSTILISSGCQFKDSKAGNNGGALYLSSSNTTVNGVSFTSNNATKGGAAHVSGGVFAINNSKFIHNFGEKLGGALSIEGKAKISLTSNKFMNNFQFDSPTSNAIYCSASNMNLDDCQFSNTFPSNNTHFAGVYCSVTDECTVHTSPSNATYHVSSGCSGSNTHPSDKPDWWLVLIACIAGAMFVVFFGVIVTFVGFKIRNALRRRKQYHQL